MGKKDFGLEVLWFGNAEWMMRNSKGKFTLNEAEYKFETVRTTP